MFMGLGMPIPDLSNKPGPGRPGWGPAGTYDFQFRVEGTEAVVIKANAAAGGSFTVQWPNGNTQVLSGNNASITAPDATDGIVSINNENDADYCDEFAVVGGKGVVREVLSWGSNPWTTLSSAFLNCTNLTDISTTSLITGSGCVLTSAFQNCTSLAEVNISSWDMTNAARIDQMFYACTGLEVFQASNLNLNHTSRWWLNQTGTAVTNGCEYRLNGLNITANSYGASNMTSWWANMKINPASSFANISWPSTTHAGADFQGSSITGVNSILDCSGWTNYNSGAFPKFSSLTATEGGASNMKINITNLSVSSVTSFNRSFMSSHISEIIGLGGLGATNGANNMEYAFLNASYMNFTNHNFSSAFINSFNLGSSKFIQCFSSCGFSLAPADASSPPNLHSLDLSSVTSLSQSFYRSRFSTAPDFSNVTMSPTTAYNLTSCFQNMALSDNSNVNSLFSKTFKVSNFTSTFSTTTLPSIIIGNGVDFSSCTTMTRMFQSATATDVQLPTNMDLGNMTGVNSFQYSFLSGPTLSTCQVDNFIRRLHATALTNGLAIDFNNAAVTESPSVVQSLESELTANGWSITVNSTDATIPFEYTGSLAPNTPITPTNNTGGAFTGIFSSSNSNIAVNDTTGVINSPNGGSTTIRYTLADGCYTEQAIQLVSAEFSYSASAYCDNAPDPTPTVTGTSGGIFTATLKVVPFQMQFEVASGVEKTIEIYASSTGNFTIDWGDNSTVLSNYTTGTISHTYNTGNVGTTVDPIISIGAQNDDPVNGAKHTTNSASDLIDIPQWGNMEFSKYQFQDRFQGCNNSRFQISATDAPNIETPVWNMRRLFYYATHFNSDISHWNADAGASLSQAFLGSNFNQPLNSWDVSRVASFDSTFSGTPFNQDLSGWDTSSATSFYLMFFAASSFNQNLSDWDISSLAGLSAKRMFRSTTALTDENYTDTVVGWAVFVYNNSGTPSTVDFTGTSPAVFIGTRTSDLASGQTYAAKYGSNWTATGWTTAQDAFDYLTTTLSWSIN